MQKICYALGFFDGVHRGHRAILNAAKEQAHANGMVSGVFTYENHPKTIISGISPPLLTTADERSRLFSACGIEKTVMLKFTADFARQTPEEFVELLARDYNCGGVCCGENFFFGIRGSGNAELLQHLCHKKNILCRVVRPVKIGEVQVSSTEIRKMIEKGRVDDAAEALCRHFSLAGEIIHGDGRGHQNGVPTINFEMHKDAIKPRAGVYASFIRLDGQIFCGVTNVGTRPTFYKDGNFGVETHLLDYNGDFYGKNARVYFCKFLRDEKVFDGKTTLYSQISSDIEQAKAILLGCERRGLDELS